MAESVLTKKIGPFSGGVWLLIIGGGVGLALILKRGFGGGTPQAMPIVVETVPLKPVATPPASPPIGGPVGGPVGGPAGGPKAGGEKSSTKPPVKPPTTPPTRPPVTPPANPPIRPPITPPRPIIPQKPTIILFTALPATITIGQSVTLTWSIIGAKKVVLTRPAGPQDVGSTGTAIAKPGVVGKLSYKLTATNDVGATEKTVVVTVNPAGAADGKNIPGGFSGTCPTTGPVPPDYAQRRGQSIAVYQDRRTKTGWAIFNLGYAGDIFGINIWLANPLNYAILNRVRDSRGLRALTAGEIASLKTDVAVIAGSLNGKENKLTNVQIMSLWDKWNTPYLCTNFPRNTQVRLT